MKTTIPIILAFIFLLPQLAMSQNDDNSTTIKRIDKKEFKEAIASQEFIVLDVRTEEEFEAGHIEGAKLLDFTSDSFEEGLSSIPKSKKYLIYCQSGNRSSKALQKMKEVGFEYVLELEGGYSHWTK